MFRVTLKRIDQLPNSQADLGMRTLMWLCFTKRPLISKQLVEALGIRLGDKSFNVSQQPGEKWLTSCSLGLVTIEEKSTTIRFVHYTVKEYLYKHKESIFPDGEGTISKTCVTCLVFDEIENVIKLDKEMKDVPNHNSPITDNATSDWQSVQELKPYVLPKRNARLLEMRHPFIEYAAVNWWRHVEVCTKKDILEDVLRFLNSPLA